MEAIYWYNVTPKDEVLLLTAPINMIHHYQIWQKGIGTLPPNEPEQQHIGYEWTVRVPLCT